MRIKSDKKQLGVMVASMLLLIIISVFWIKSSYNEERFALHRESTLVFRTAIQDLEDSLRATNLILHPQSSYRRRARRLIMMDSVRIDSSRVLEGRESSGVTRRRLARQYRPSKDPRIFDGALSIHYQLTTRDTVVELRMSDNIEPDFFVEAIAKKINYGQSRGNWLMDLETLTDPDDLDQRAISTRIYHDILGDFYIVGVLKNFRTFLLGRILPEVFLSLFMLFITGAAFFMAHKNGQRQRRLVQIKDDLIANISHELQTPISTVKVALEALEAPHLHNDKLRRQEYIHISRQEVDRLSLLVDNILTEAVDSKMLNLQRRDLKTIVSKVMSTMSVRFDDKNASVSFETDDQTYIVEVDQMHVESIFYNLLDNALKYGGESPQIHVRLNRTSSHIRLEIEDNGVGIAPEYQKKIFDRLFRVPTGDRHDVKGHGLGLSRVKKIVDAHGGQIGIESAPGKGSTFNIQLPSAI